MLSNDGEPDVLSLLEQRVEFLECLRENAKDKRTLEESLPCSRSTIDRGVRKLESLGLVAYDNTGYVATSAGRLAAEEYRQFQRRIHTLLDYQPFFEWVEPDTLGLELEWLADAELVLPEPSNPYAMINRHVQRVRETTNGTFTLPYLGLHATEAAHDGIVHNGATHELIVEPNVAETLRTNPAYTKLFEEMMATGRLDVFVYDGSFPYGVGLLDDELVQIIVDETNEPRAVLETDTPEIRMWAHQKIEEYKQRATKLTPSQLQPTRN